jgi:hypothetical protein
MTATENAHIYAIRPHIYKHGSPAGSLVLDVLDANGKLIKSSSAVTISSISTANYFHGYVKFDISLPVTSGKTYQIKLRGTGYTFSASAYIGWCNDFDLRKYTADYSPNTGIDAALDMEIWSGRRPQKGDVT